MPEAQRSAVRGHHDSQIERVHDAPPDCPRMEALDAKEGALAGAACVGGNGAS